MLYDYKFDQYKILAKGLTRRMACMMNYKMLIGVVILKEYDTSISILCAHY